MLVYIVTIVLWDSSGLLTAVASSCTPFCSARTWPISGLVTEEKECVHQLPDWHHDAFQSFNVQLISSTNTFLNKHLSCLLVQLLLVAQFFGLSPALAA